MVRCLAASMAGARLALAAAARDDFAGPKLDTQAPHADVAGALGGWIGASASGAATIAQVAWLRQALPGSAEAAPAGATPALPWLPWLPAGQGSHAVP